MKLSHLLSALIALCIVPLSLFAQDNVVELTAEPGTVIVVDGVPQEVPASGILEVPAGAELSAPATTQITLGSGATVMLSPTSVVQFDNAGDLSVVAGSITFTPADSTTPVNVEAGVSITPAGDIVEGIEDGGPADTEEEGPADTAPEVPEIIEEATSETEEDATVGQDPTQTEPVGTPL